MRRLALLAALAPAFAFAAPARAYWEYGHETIARIAMANVRPATARAVRRILADQKLLGTPECPAGTPAEASVWADCIKPLRDAAGQSRFGYAYSWHYQNVNVCQPFDLASACAKGDCVSAQIERDVALLKDRRTPRAERIKALAFLIHFVGDLHQPLHAGDKADKGGNDVGASYGIYAPRRFNLHSVWDGPLAERAITSGPALVRRYPAARRARIAAGTVTDWSREAWQVSRDTVYASALGGDPCAPSPARVALSDATIARDVPAARLEVLRGGLRLAKLMDEALSWQASASGGITGLPDYRITGLPDYRGHSFRSVPFRPIPSPGDTPEGVSPFVPFLHRGTLLKKCPLSSLSSHSFAGDTPEGVSPSV